MDPIVAPHNVQEQDQPHLVSLVLQSKKALQHGEQLCSQAHALSNDSAQVAVDILVLDARVRWISDSVLEQLKLAANVAKTIEEKRIRLTKQVHEWDAVRAKQCSALDSILDELGSQRVPPDFHQTSAGSSLFGSQNSDDEGDSAGKPNGFTLLSQSPSDTVRIPPSRRRHSTQEDRSNWKTLRDFVDDQAIEDILEQMDNERVAVENTLSRTDDYPESLDTTITNIRNALPQIPPIPDMEQLLHEQDTVMVSMARHLESLASHYEQMANALHESEAGEAYSEEDVEQMNRDTDELPSIMKELEESLLSVAAIHESLSSKRTEDQRHLQQLSGTLDDLDELGDIMGEMLNDQEAIESECEGLLVELQSHLSTIEHLHERYVAYRIAFQKLVIEIARRRMYKEAAENIVRGMMSQLEAMTEEERLVREHFNNEHGAHLPEDLCLCIGNAPTKWQVIPWNGEELEDLPGIATDIARDKLNSENLGTPVIGTESL
ncbi:kinase activator [Moniliophthora roreri MCA 2997]|uniref:Autophagy-related protein 17 n=1 Tax=Moniliophthora roreri (strain MCA 2997) TaxID=1381753 RepID=V2XP71_MONRO|nr:kinase activator [Moniliophthora roreri MCA 2997]